MMTPAYAVFSYARSMDQDAKTPARHPVVVVGAGPIGLAAAIDLAQRDVPVVLLDDNDRIGEGSRAICFSKKALEVLDRLGCARALVADGVSWSRGKVFQGKDELYAFDLLPEAGHKMPAFINIQQFVVEKALVDRAAQLPNLDLRWKNKVVAIENGEQTATLTIETPDGPYQLIADHVIACDGARSPLRGMLGLDFTGEIFEEQFLIADVKMHGDFPAERWFWFDPPFHKGGSALLHKQPDDIWRIDLQLPASADPDWEKKPENVTPRIVAMLGHANFTLEWVSIYRFRCLRLEKFTHGRVVFAGDAAHQVSPFGARGANSGFEDSENIAWKLALVLAGKADASLLASYDQERGEGADDNLGHSTRSTDFIAPHSATERVLRDAALALARHYDFAKRFVNSGRLSVPTAYRHSALSTADSESWAGGVAPGAPIPDARIRHADGAEAYLSDCLLPGFALLTRRADAAALCPEGVTPLEIGDHAIGDSHKDVALRFALVPDAAYLLRPDAHVAARFQTPDRAAVLAAYRRACGQN